MKDIDRLLEEFEDSPAPSLERIAGIALELSEISSASEAALEKVKKCLRQKASERAENPCFLRGVSVDDKPLGTVTVTFPDAMVKVSKDADMGALRDRLGADFDLYFDVILTHKPKKDIMQHIKGPDNPVLEVLEYAEQTPRVGFKPVS